MIDGDQRHAELAVELMGLEGCNGLGVPAAKGAEDGDDKELNRRKGEPVQGGGGETELHGPGPGGRSVRGEGSLQEHGEANGRRVAEVEATSAMWRSTPG